MNLIKPIKKYISDKKKALNDIYNGDSKSAYCFRYTLLIIDVVTVVFLVISTFFYGSKFVLIFDAIFGAYLAADYLARFWIAKKKRRFVVNLLNIADLAATLAFLMPLILEQFAFLRVLRVFRLLRSYRLQKRLREDFTYFKKHETIILRAINLFIFVFIMTELVFITQVGINPNISNFLDALYFSISTLTTTGFGDIVLIGKYGHMLSIVIMIFGVSLFLRLMQSIFYPSKIHSDCKNCGLFLHENDSKHCKHCGTVLKIPHHQ